MTQRKNDSKSERKLRFANHPWISLFVFAVLLILSAGIAANITINLFKLPSGSLMRQLIQPLLGHFLLLFILVPFVMRLPEGNRSFREYLDDIRLTNVKPLFRLIILAFSCYLILALCQVLGTVIFRFFEGLKISGEFVLSVIDISHDLPPQSWSLLVSFPSVFEEVAFRGIILTMFLRKYSERKSIIISAAAFGLIHLLNLTGGRDIVWVGGQVVWSFILGLFYGYLFVKSKSLIPNMIFHYLANVFVGSFTAYVQTAASTGIEVVYGILFTFGIVPTTFMILWVRFFVSKLPLSPDAAIARPAQPSQ